MYIDHCCIWLDFFKLHILQKNKPPYTPDSIKPGEIKFDENGKLLFPTLYDPEYPTGDYEYKAPEIKNTIVPQEIKESHFYKNVLNKVINENKNKMFECISGDLKQEIKITPKFKMFVDNFVPNNNIYVDQDTTIEEVISSIYDSSVELAKDHILSSEEITNYLAFNGINFKKEFNKVKKNAQISNLGGGGIKPPSVPDINTNFPQNVTVIDAYHITKQDNEIRYGFAIAYSAILPTLTVVSGITAFFTFGISIAVASLDILFCSLEIANAWIEYHNAVELENLVYKLLKNYANDKFRDIIKSLASDPKWFELTNDIFFKSFRYKNIISENWIVVKSCVSFLAITVQIAMPILEDLLLRIL